VERGRARWWTAGGFQSVLAAKLCPDRNARAADAHEVHFVFDPASFKLGLAITILSILMAVALTVWAELRP
jgi:hypothetical protein